MRERQAAVDLQRLAERLGGSVIVVLLEVGDADVVGAVGPLEAIACGVRRLIDGAGNEQNSGGQGDTAKHHGVTDRTGLALSRPLPSCTMIVCPAATPAT